MIVNESHVRALVREQIKNKLVLDSYSRACDEILEARQLNEFDLSSLASSAASFLGDNMGGAFTDSIKQYLVELLFKRLESMGLPTDRTSIVGGAIVNTIEELEWTNLSKYFDNEDACEEIAGVLMGGIQEGLQEQGINAFIEVMFGAGARAEGMIGSPIRELINNKIKEMTESLRQPISDFFCDHNDFDKLVSDFKSGLPDMEIGGKSASGGVQGAAAAAKKYTDSELYDMIGRGS